MTVESLNRTVLDGLSAKGLRQDGGAPKLPALVFGTLHEAVGKGRQAPEPDTKRSGTDKDVLSVIADLQKANGGKALSPEEQIKKTQQDSVDKLNKAADEKLKKDEEAIPVKPSADQKRPQGDTRSAEQIINDSPLLKNLGTQDNVDRKLADKVGDYKHDADAAYRAVKVLEYIEKVGRDGKPAAQRDELNNIGNGQIDGYTKGGEARHDSEAGRLQDFTRGKGYADLVDGGTRRQDVPSIDKLTAQDIQNANPLLKDLTNDNGVRDKLKEKVGDFDLDANAAARALGVLGYIKTSKDDNGNDRASGVTDNGRIDGFDVNGLGARGSEAGLLQDYLKSGGDALKKDHRLDPVEAPKPQPTNNNFGPDQTRPEGDYRSAPDIIAGSKLLKNLGDQHGTDGGPSLKEALKKQVGDYEQDADAAYRAVQVLEHVEKYDENGKEIKNRPASQERGSSSPGVDTVGNGLIDGFTSSGDAQHGTEAGRLQDFGKHGYDSLKGGDKNPPPPPPPPLLPLENAVRPDGDNRSAQEIIDANPTLKNLGDQEGVKDNLKKQVGDYENDANAAYRASQVIDYIKNVDETGQPITKKSGGNDTGNDRIDGFFKDADGAEKANHGTEAGRLKDFGKDGYSSLKGIDGKSASGLISHLNSDATSDAVKAEGGDPAKLGKDYFTNGKTDANGADKTAALIKLGETLAKYKSGQEAYQSTGPGDNGPYLGEGPSPGQERDAFYKDVQAKIDQLAKDPDVQTFSNQKLPDALHARVDADPKLKAELQRRLDNASSTHALEDAFAKNDKDGKPVSTAEALGKFIEKPNFYAQALNVKPNLQEALKNAPKEIQDKVKAGYDSITSGEEIKSLTDSGKPADKAIIESGVNKAVFDGFFDDKTVQQGTEKFNEATAQISREKLLDGKSIEDLFKGLGVKDANDPALEEIVKKNLDNIAPPGPDRPAALDIVVALRSIGDTGRGSAKYDDAIAKIGREWGNKLPQNVSAAYKTGVMHAASSVLLVGALATSSATGTQGSPGIVTAQSFQAAGLLTEGGAKFVGDQMSRFNNQFPDPTDEAALRWNKAALTLVRDVENVGKATGGVVGSTIGLIAGSLSAADAAARGDKVNAGFQGTFAGLNGISAVAGATEVGAYVVGRIAGQAIAEAAAVVGGVAGTVAGVVGGIAAIGGLIYSIVASVKADEKKNQEIDVWYAGIKNDLATFGITPPDRDTTLAKPNAYPQPGSNATPVA